MARSEAGKTLPFPSTLVATPSASNSSTVRSTLSDRSAGPRNLPPAAEGLLDAPGPPGLAGVVGRVDRPGDDPEVAQPPGVGEVAPGPAGHQDLHARPPVLLQQEDREPALGRPDRRAEARRPGPQDRDVVNGRS